MAQRLFVIDPLPWWRSRHAGVGALLGAIALVLGGWLTWPSDDDAVPHRPELAVRLTVAVPSQSPLPSAAVAERPVAALQAVGSPPSRPAPPALSTEVSPGMHITPLSVPPGTTPEPAGPRDGDSEPEN